ncbi:MAG: glycerol-3-phosphate 1-O-acyltransferase PlsY [Fibromonadaceae bacterium]|jgi:glycerol-3-phosphate acyltransferase PlsY|nr:glycerol-3-phosphate 1-O-acyltransferase PlsY [Fibromonadaceae bacterium]
MFSFLALPIAYLLGSIPSAVWVSKIYKSIDIREYGSKNAGLTNVFRVLGWKPALPVIAIDLSKGFLAVFIANMLNSTESHSDVAYSWLPIAAGLLTIFGHSFTCMAGFKGGKGVLTTLGVILALQPVLALTCFAFWGFLFVATMYVSVASIGACVMLATLATLGYVSDILPAYRVDGYILALSWVVSVFVAVKHKVNMVRLWNGTENGFGKKRKT